MEAEWGGHGADRASGETLAEPVIANSGLAEAGAGLGLRS